jgi:hypothetical protein
MSFPKFSRGRLYDSWQNSLSCTHYYAESDEILNWHERSPLLARRYSADRSAPGARSVFPLQRDCAYNHFASAEHLHRAHDLRAIAFQSVGFLHLVKLIER